MPKTNLRKEAAGRNCMIRIPGVCKNNRETVVLCHLNNKRLFGAGMGMKVPDMFGAWGCNDCHDVVDFRRECDMGNAERLIMFYEGVFRTQKILLDEGKIGVLP